MTDTPVPDVRKIAMATLHALSHPHWTTRSGVFPCVGDHDGIGCTVADAVLAAVEPVIRRQERATTADEIANDLAARANSDDVEYWSANEAEVLRSAAAIARSHSTREEQDHG